MRKFSRIIAIAILTLSTVLLGCSKKKSIVGEWKGTDNSGRTMSLVFDKDHSVMMKSNGETMGGKDYMVNGHKLEIKYEIDETKDPMWLDLVFYEDGKKSEGNSAKGIFKYLSDNKIELRSGFAKPDRFDKFDETDKDNTMILERVAQ